MINPTLVKLLHQFNIQTVVDVGASDGRFSRELWSSLPGAKYILVDPIEYPEKWEGHNVEWFHNCLHSVRKKAMFFTQTPDPFQSGCYGKDAATQSVETITLPDVCRDSEAIFLKLDTHGVEVDILEKFLPALRERIPAIQIEVYNFHLHGTNSLHFSDMVQRMAGWGYRVATLLDCLHRADGCMWQMDLLFLHDDAPVFDRNDFFYH
jgi:FkbM family methyltransferase